MVTLILELLSTSLQILYMLLQKYFAYTEQEKEQKRIAIRTWIESGKTILYNLTPRFDEDAYLNAVDDFTKLRYLRYRAIATDILASGAGIEVLEATNIAGFGQRIIQLKPAIINILLKDINYSDKAKMIASIISKV